MTLQKVTLQKTNSDFTESDYTENEQLIERKELYGTAGPVPVAGSPPHPPVITTTGVPRS